MEWTGTIDLGLEKQPYSVEEIAAHWRVSRGAIYELIKAGKIPAIRLGRTIRIPREVGEKLLREGLV
jgi:excisionase family DNA binding protein